MFYKKSFSSKFRYIHIKTPVLESLFNEVANFQGYNFTKNKTPTQVFLCKYCEIFKKIYFEEHLRTTASVLNGFFRAYLLLLFNIYYIFITNFYFTFVSSNTFISLSNFITYRDSYAKLYK